MKDIKKEKGFTLIELLTTILIISIAITIGTFFVINIINNSTAKSQELTSESLITSARIYIKENPDEVIWTPDEQNIDELYSCISIKTLISKNLIKREKRNIKNNETQYIKVTKNMEENIISEKIDTKTCPNTQNIKIPTSKEYCNNITYDGTEWSLTKNTNETLFYFIDRKETNAGNYTVTAKLPEEKGYTWEDGTTTEKTITCTIKKAYPILKITPSGTSTITIGNSQIAILTSNLNGTIQIKSSNNNYITATTTDNKIVANDEKEITITSLATRNTKTIITITITPEDTKNYYSSSTIYTIANSKKQIIPVPTAEKYCKKDLFYNGQSQTLVNNSEAGFKFDPTTTHGTNTGNYIVTATLNYGYIWDNDSAPLEDKTIECSIKEKEVIVKYDSNEGTTCSPIGKTVIYQKKYGTLCIPKRDNYLFLGWYTQKENGNKITENSNVTTMEDHTLYAHWKKVSCELNYTGTLGKNNWYTSVGKVNLTTTNLKTDEIQEQNVTTNSQEPFTKLTTTTQNDTNETIWYGYVKDVNNHIITCQKTFKIDTIPPDKPTITNPTNGNETNQSFSLTVKSNDNGSGIAYWQYKYTNTSWTAYNNSNKNRFTTTPFSIPRNELVYIRACDYAGNCSKSSSTRINITSCSEKNPTSCTKLYTCKSATTNSYIKDQTFIRNMPNSKSSQELTLWSGSLVYKISESGNYYYVYVPKSVEFSSSNPYYNLGRYGYIYKGCLRTSPPSSAGNWCTNIECNG